MEWKHEHNLGSPVVPKYCPNLSTSPQQHVLDIFPQCPTAVLSACLEHPQLRSKLWMSVTVVPSEHIWCWVVGSILIIIVGYKNNNKYSNTVSQALPDTYIHNLQHLVSYWLTYARCNALTETATLNIYNRIKPKQKVNHFHDRFVNETNSKMTGAIFSFPWEDFQNKDLPEHISKFFVTYRLKHPMTKAYQKLSSLLPNTNIGHNKQVFLGHAKEYIYFTPVPWQLSSRIKGI